MNICPTIDGWKYRHREKKEIQTQIERMEKTQRERDGKSDREREGKYRHKQKQGHKQRCSKLEKKEGEKHWEEKMKMYMSFTLH